METLWWCALFLKATFGVSSFSWMEQSFNLELWSCVTDATLGLGKIEKANSWAPVATDQQWRTFLFMDWNLHRVGWCMCPFLWTQTTCLCTWNKIRNILYIYVVASFVFKFFQYLFFNFFWGISLFLPQNVDPKFSWPLLSAFTLKFAKSSIFFISLKIFQTSYQRIPMYFGLEFQDYHIFQLS